MSVVILRKWNIVIYVMGDTPPNDLFFFLSSSWYVCVSGIEFYMKLSFSSISLVSVAD